MYTVVGIPDFATYCSSDNFNNFDKYIPGRWLEGGSLDKHDGFHLSILDQGFVLGKSKSKKMLP